MRAQFEKILPQESSSFNAFAYEMDEFDSPWHYHPEYELTYIVSSHGVRYTGNSFENFEEDDLVLLGSNLPHCWKNTGEQPEKASAIVMQWDDRLLGADWLKQHEFSSIRKLLQLSAQGLKFDTDLARKLKNKLQTLLELPPFQKLIAFLEILDELASSKQMRVLCDRSFHDELNYEDHERINHVFQYVRKNYKQKIRLANVAGETHMTEESFSRFFSKLMNKPFFSFLNEYRINAACKMLIESDIGITQISYACGFESLPFFYRQFKRYKGNSPRQYRIAFQRINLS
jgi:AraC-like DNA-binding protein